MLITDIKQQKKDEKRYSIFIDGSFAFGITDVDVLFYKLKINEELSEEKYQRIMDDKVTQDCRDVAFKYLGYKMRTEKEVRTKLKEKEFPESIIEDTIKLIKNYSYIDDEKYAKEFIKEKIKVNNYGTYRIKQQLREKGVSKELIDEMDFPEDSQLENAIKLLNRKYGKIQKPDFKEKQKIYAFLQRKGYSFDIIGEAYKSVFENDFESDDYYG